MRFDRREVWTMEKKTFAVIGGDIRYAHLASQLCADGHTVFAACLEKAREYIGNAVIAKAAAAAAMSEIVILHVIPADPLGNVSAPLSDNIQQYSQQFCSLLGETTVFAGMPHRLAGAGEHAKRLKIYDYSARESFIIRNAQATAEGVIACAVQKMPVTLCGSTCTVTGFGRTARFTAILLSSFGAKINIAARSETDRAWAMSLGYNAVPLSALENIIGNTDLLVNTVPAEIIGEPLLRRIKKGCVIIDIASAPGGVDTYTASKLNIACFCELGLPGRFSPVTAAGIIKDTVLAMLDEELS